MANATIDHDEIRSWAEAKGGKPAAVDRTHQGGDVGIIRIMFPNNQQSEHHSLVEISWDEFFRQFEESQLALLYDKDSLFSKIVGRDTLERREHGEHASRHHPDPRSRHETQGESQQSGAQHRNEAQRGPGTGEKRGDREGADLESREYEDAKGNVHHHTKSYMEQHRKD